MSAPDTTTPPARQAQRRRDERGATLVEMALVLPLFLTLVFGIIEFGFYFAQVNETRHVAREAARLAAVDGSPTDVANAITGELNLIDPASVTYSFAVSDTGGESFVRVCVEYQSLTGFLDWLELEPFESEHSFFVEPDRPAFGSGGTCA